MKKVVIVHCWEGTPEYCWYPQTKKELEELGFVVEVPAMPDAENPNMQTWVPTLASRVGEPNESVYLVGHSIGCAAIMRYLESLPENQKVGGVVFVAGFVDDLGYKELANFFETPINLAKIKTRANKFVAIHSDNDPFVPLNHGGIFKEQLGAELIVKQNMGHFSGPINNEESCVSLPDVTQAIQKISNN